MAHKAATASMTVLGTLAEEQGELCQSLKAPL
jgi:hypothetical protein